MASLGVSTLCKLVQTCSSHCESALCTITIVCTRQAELYCILVFHNCSNSPECVVNGILFLLALQLVWIETPTNPTMKVVDIKACSELVHEHNKDIVVVVDNTFMSAYFQVRE